jgi:hypothetical protein
MQRGTIEAENEIGDLVHVEASMHSVDFDHEIKSSITGYYCGFIEETDVLIKNDGGRLQAHPDLITCWVNMED